jgi:glycine cleavage system H protein
MASSLLRMHRACQAKAMMRSQPHTLDSELVRPIVNLKYMAEKEVKVSDQHVWVGGDDQHVLLGLTNYIQGALGTVISVELPDIGDKIEEGEVFAEIETVSTVHECVSPISGTVLAVNPHLDNHASIINEDPYSEGWLIEVRLKDSSELNALMDMDEYYHFVFKDTP